MPTRQCWGSTSRFDSDPYSVCPAWCTNARSTVTVYYRVLISERQRGWVRGTRPLESRSFASVMSKAMLSNARGLFVFGNTGILDLMPETTITLYRPVGQAEFDLIRASGFVGFPPRLPEQSIFYPVLSEEYAVQIARDWNTKDERSGFAGYVLRFDVMSSFLDNYQVHTAGSSKHKEYWIPAGDLDQFNQNIVGPIKVLRDFRSA